MRRSKSEVWRDAVAVMLGAWLVASWTLGLASAAGAAANAVIIGLLVVVHAHWAMHIYVTSGDGAASDIYRRHA